MTATTGPFRTEAEAALYRELHTIGIDAWNDAHDMGTANYLLDQWEAKGLVRIGHRDGWLVVRTFAKYAK